MFFALISEVLYSVWFGVHSFEYAATVDYLENIGNRMRSEERMRRNVTETEPHVRILRRAIKWFFYN